MICKKCGITVTRKAYRFHQETVDGVFSSGYTHDPHWLHVSVDYRGGVERRAPEGPRDQCGGEPIKATHRPGRKAPRTGKGRDTQRSRVYAWENDNIEGHFAAYSRKGYRLHVEGDLTIDQCEAFANEIGRDYRWSHIRVEAGRFSGRAYGTSRITLGRPTRTPTVICHEVAHLLAPPEERHGPVFMRQFIELLVRYCGLDRQALTQSARAARLKVAPATKARKPRRRLSPARLRRALAAR